MANKKRNNEEESTYITEGILYGMSVGLIIGGPTYWDDFWYGDRYGYRCIYEKKDKNTKITKEIKK